PMPTLSPAERAAAPQSSAGRSSPAPQATAAEPGAQGRAGETPPVRRSTVAPAPSPTEKPPTPPTIAPATAPQPAQASICPSSPASWQLVTLKNIDNSLTFDLALTPV